MSGEILSPKIDIVFKILFGSDKNRDILKAFLSDMLDIPAEELHNLKVKNAEVNPESINEKYYRLDLNLDIGDQLVNIEMQVRAEKFYTDRTLVYWSKLYSSQLDEGAAYSDLCPCISINILDYNLFDGHDDIHSEFGVWDIEHMKKLSDKMEIHFFELKKANNGIDVNNRKQLWLQFIRSETKEEFDMLKQANDPIINRSIDAVYNMSSDEKTKELVRMREKAMHDKISELNEAKQEGIKQAIDLMRSLGFSEEQIEIIENASRKRHKGSETVMNTDAEREKEFTRMREKAMHDKISELHEAEQEGIEKGIKQAIDLMRSLGFSEEQIEIIENASRKLSC